MRRNRRMRPGDEMAPQHRARMEKLRQDEYAQLVKAGKLHIFTREEIEAYARTLESKGKVDES